MEKKNNCNIGGQAVLEGVMMRGPSSMVTAVRNPQGEIVLESSRLKPLSQKPKIYRLPIIRGIISFANSFILGIKIINRSGEVFGDLQQEKPSKFEKWLAKTFKVDMMSVFVVIAAILGIFMGIGLFVLVPQLISTAVFKLAGWEYQSFKMRIAYNLFAGFLRMGIFIGYIALVSLMKEIKRLFMYHGAEHKTISAYEHNLELTVENVQKMRTVHDRCGTTFMFIVMVISILFFAAFPVDVLVNAGTVANFIVRVLSRIILIPIVAGISYELLKLFSKYDNAITRILKKPGLLLQKLTTKEPQDDMVEVAIAAFSEVLLLEEDKDRQLQSFVTYSTVDKIIQDLLQIIEHKNEAELIVMSVLGVKTKTELYDGRRVDNTQKEMCLKFARRRQKGAPIQYVLNNACFYGYDFYVDSRVLIPRFDTEILAQTAIKILKYIPSAKVLDLCTGSGAIAITVAKECLCEVTATDISQDALEVAKQNALSNKVDITFKQGSLFAPVKGQKFDVITCNPPYIPDGDIPSLESQVRDYEPMLALKGGQDGLDFIKDIIDKAHKHLNEQGFLIMEIGKGQDQFVAELLQERYEAELVYDFNNPPIARVAVAKLKELGEDNV
ncbi:MAG: peptide chain release factor N(5)-glutamine methyltransferase [Clostridiales bacterium]|nr:peptide chain release factor N(5)-glutamine methyltransferase [Clostridiales bacterium]